MESCRRPGWQSAFRVAFSFDQVVAAELLLGLGERAVGGGNLAIPDPDGRGGVRRLERVAADIVAALLDVLGEGGRIRP